MHFSLESKHNHITPFRNIIIVRGKLVSDVTSSSSVEISVHYIFGLSESSRMRMTSSPSCGCIAADMFWCPGCNYAGNPDCNYACMRQLYSLAVACIGFPVLQGDEIVLWTMVDETTPSRCADNVAQAQLDEIHVPAVCSMSRSSCHSPHRTASERLYSHLQ